MLPHQLTSIDKEVQSSYLDYAMSVIVARALPDVRDGLKPVQRRILYAMWRLGLKPSAKFAKSARIVGSVLGHYHPHGDVSVYDALVRMAQPFSLRYPLIEGQGNFGCFTGDTKVHLIDGRSLTFYELIEEERQGKKNYTYTYNNKTKKIEVARIHAPRRTKRNEGIVKVTLDNGEEIRSTPKHKFMLRSGLYREAKNLKTGDSLMPVYIRLSTKVDDPHMVGYEMVHQPNFQSWEYAHCLADDLNITCGVYEHSKGKVRHHVDFNKRNNNPENILRLPWEEHWRVHYEFTSRRHKIDSEYRRKLAEGRKAYFAREEVKEKIGKRIGQWNQKMWRDPFYREGKINAVKALWKDPEYKVYMAGLASARLQAKWREESFRKTVGKHKSEEMKRKWQNSEYRKHQEQAMGKLSQKIWANPKHRIVMSGMMKELWKDEQYRKQRSSTAKALWEDPDHRNKFPQEYFVRAALKLWQNPYWREFHSGKINEFVSRELEMKKQWECEGFREKVFAAVKSSNYIRLKENPNLMKDLTRKAKTALKKNWKNPEYKKRVVSSKVLGFARKIIDKHGVLTREIYETERLNNGVPAVNRLPEYFFSFEELAEKAKHYNHKVVSVEFIHDREDVYDLTVEGTHNFALASGVFVHNSIDGDPAAAMRYSEAKLAKPSEELLEDLDKETVTWKDNFDGSLQEPDFLPARAPTLLLNGAQGIAVGMATNIPPHNLGEVCDALLHLIDNPQASLDEILSFIKGPDFPTGGIIYDSKGIKEAYGSGRGAIPMRARVDIKEDNKRSYIAISELPYQVNKSDLITHIAELVREGKIDGIQDIIDGSREGGVHIVIELKKAAHEQKVLNQLYVHTQLQKNFNVLMIALVDGIEPRLLSLPELLTLYIEHHKSVVTKKIQFLLAQAKARLHILEGLSIALDHLDEVIGLIRKAENKQAAKSALEKTFSLSSLQAEAILMMRLQDLARLERDGVLSERKEKEALVKGYEAVLVNPKKIAQEVKKEIKEVKEKYQDKRRTEVKARPLGKFEAADLIPKETTLLALTKNGYVKRTSPKTYQTQGRGGVGIIGMGLQEGDAVFKIARASTHDNVLFFGVDGRLFITKAYEISEKGRTAKGDGLYELFQNSAPIYDMQVLAEDMDPKAYFLFIVGRSGLMKRVPLEGITASKRNGIKIMNLKEGDECIGGFLVKEGQEVLAITSNGLASRFNVSEVRPMGRAASGVRGIRLKEGDHIASVVRLDNPEGAVVIISEKGFGKRVRVKGFTPHHRGGSGMKASNVTAKTGKVKTALFLGEATSELLLYSQNGKTLQTELKKIALLGRMTQGVRIMRLKAGDAIASAVLVEAEKP